MDALNVLDKLDALLNNEYLLGAVNRGHEKKIKTYKPTKKTIDKHGEVSLNPDIGTKVGKLSVLTMSVHGSTCDSLLKFCEMFFQFKRSQIDNMDEEKKKELLAVAIGGMMKTIKAHRNRLVPYDTYFPEEYEQNKLKVLMKSGKEPKLATEEHYNVLERLLRELLYEASRRYLVVEDEEGRSPSSIYSSWEQEKFGELAKNFLKKTGYDNNNLLEIVRDYYFKHGRDLNEEQIKEFQELPICPFTNMLDKSGNYSKQNITYILFDMMNRSYIWGYLTKENLDKFIEWMIYLGESFVKKEEGRIIEGENFNNSTEYKARQLFYALKEIKLMVTKKK